MRPGAVADQHVARVGGTPARQEECRKDRADAERREQHRVGLRRTARHLARDQGQQAGQRGGLREEQRHAQQDGVHPCRLPHVLCAHPNRARGSARRQRAGLALAPPPSSARPESSESAAIEHEYPLCAGTRDQYPGDDRAHDARRVHRDAVQRHRRRQLHARHQFRHDRRVDRPAHRQPEPVGEHQHEKQRGIDHVGDDRDAEQCRGARRPELRDQQVATPVDDVGHCAARQTEQEHRQGGRGLHERDHDRGSRQRGHHPGSGDIVHPQAQIRDQRDAPQPAEHRQRERCPGGCIGWELPGRGAAFPRVACPCVARRCVGFRCFARPRVARRCVDCRRVDGTSVLVRLPGFAQAVFASRQAELADHALAHHELLRLAGHRHRELVDEAHVARAPCSARSGRGRTRGSRPRWRVRRA